MTSIVAAPDVKSPVASSAEACDVVQLAERRLQAGAYPVLRNVSCEFTNGLLILSGVVGSFYLKQMAQTLVSRIPGVERVDNRLQVMPAR